MKSAALLSALFLGIGFVLSAAFLNPSISWMGYGHDAQHTGLSGVAAQDFARIKWSTPVDENPVSGEILAHYGSAVITPGNTVLVPVRLFDSTYYAIRAFNGGTAGGADPTPIYTLTSDFVQPNAANWTPSFSGTLTIRNRYYYPGAGGSVYYIDHPDTHNGDAPDGQIPLVDDATYSANKASFDRCVKISTPMTADRTGNIFFGFRVDCETAGAPYGFAGGIARIGADGSVIWRSAANISGGARSAIPLNSAPALSNDQRKIYAVVSEGGYVGSGYLVALNAGTLGPLTGQRVFLADPATGDGAGIYDDASASPMVGSDGDVYFGVVETICCTRNDRGWMLHYNGTLDSVKTPGGFGWDDTASVVPASSVPGYRGTSKYLILTKYNNYADFADGLNRLAILDPNSSSTDPYSPTVRTMREVLTVPGPTSDAANHPDKPNAVKEWCINAAAVDPIRNAAMVNSEDGVLYWWDFATNALTQSIRLTNGIGEAYTPTVIGPDGTVYAINDQRLFAVGK